MTSKQKYFGSIGLVFALLGVLWFLGIRKTIDVRSELDRNQILSQRIENADRLITNYQSAIDGYGNTSKTTKPYSEENLFNFIEREVAENKGDILEYLPQQDLTLDNAVVKTKKIQVSGTYYNLVRCLHSIESQPAITKVLSTSIQMVENRKTRKSYLVLELYIQNVIMS